ncbi:adhesin [Paraburkholderia sp. PREW-6R]|uniref:adhesin n=1 Tax=Paraburkholderia sp. PREW-6R TaxID=3141544 RepID=UPI0031F594E3
MSTPFSLDRLESLVQSRDYDAAHAEVVSLLDTLIDRRGTLPDDKLARIAPNEPADAQSQQTLQRIADALTTLLSDARFQLSDKQFAQLFWGRPWINMLFAVTTYGNTDHIVRALLAQTSASDDLAARNALTRKQLALYTAESLLEIDLVALAENEPVLAASLGVSMLGAAVVISPAAHAKRERMIEWLPAVLDTIDDLDDLPNSAVCAAYMHCSYSLLPQRHAIKRSINRLVRNKLQTLGLLDWELKALSAPVRDVADTRKPVMLVVLEWFTGGHSIYRTHSRTMLAAREHFEVVAFGEAQHVDEAGRATFDRFIPFEYPEYIGDCVRQLQAFVDEHRPQVLYMPSVGMFAHTVFASNVRFAPLQIAGLGHPATMHATQMDYVSVEEDFVGDPGCFSEKLLRLPKDGQPYRPSKLFDAVTPAIAPPGDYINIAVTASAMKINPRFLQACRAIIESAGIPVRLHFMTAWSEGVDLAYVRKSILAALPEERTWVYGSINYPRYLKILNTMDMFLSPFPFGNTNGIVDSLTLGLPGVNLCGAEVFEHIDSGLFARAGLPGWLTTSSVDEYVRAAVRLANQHDEREALRQRLIDEQAVERLFEGRPEAFGEAVLTLLSQTAGKTASNP